ncbi:MAG: hypothetical protein CSB33_04505 [Desulfobacterales bacterium]|nr:MAG: hypothetical protein CSB33_04505 [Desulfobacterales bacterium]
MFSLLKKLARSFWSKEGPAASAKEIPPRDTAGGAPPEILPAKTPADGKKPCSLSPGPEGTPLRTLPHPDRFAPLSADADTGPETTASSEKRKKQNGPPLNKHGIPVLRSESDIRRAFPADEPEAAGKAAAPKSRLAHQNQKITTVPPRIPKPGYPRNRHGIPIFSPEMDFSTVFKDSGAAVSRGHHSGPDAGKDGPPSFLPDNAEFSRLLAEHLAGKTDAEILAAKTDRPAERRPETRRDVLMSWPPPQEELDLHGRTGRQAAALTESFVRTARARGKRTVLIITGKGLHSNGRPVLPDVVETQLAALRQQGLVRTFIWDQGRKRKNGAIAVYLNTPV